MRTHGFPYLRWSASSIVCLGILGVFIEQARLPAADPASPPATPVAKYAPAGDLLDQVNAYVDRLRSDLSDEARYTAEYQDRVAKDANTLAVLALVLGMHEETTPLKRAAPQLISAAEELAASADDFGQARKALDGVIEAMQSASDESVDWAPVGDVAQLMKQVPIVNNNLRRAATSRRFDREIDKITGFAATLAAIAQVTSNNTDYCSGADDERRWAAISVAMRDASAEVAQAARDNNPEQAKVALEKIVKTCDQCHAEFR